MKARILFISLFLAVNMLKGQGVMNTFLNNYIQPPPDVASLGKYIDFPVGYYTGVPRINIPIYTLNDGKVNLPISLDYHAGGITVSQLASSVGLGWVLNAGGMVMRSVRGAPDEGTAKNCGAGCYSYPRGYYIDSGLKKMQPMNSGYNVDLWTGANIDGSMQGYYDFEPDLYFFNFNGHTGKFVFDENRNPVLLSDDNIKIAVQENESLRRFQWIFTTPDGVKYFFGENSLICSNLPITLTTGGGSSADADAQAPSGWYLTRIVYPNSKDTVYFSYTAENYGYYDIAPQQQLYNTFVSGSFPNTYYACGNSPAPTPILYTLAGSERLARISTKNYHVDFIAKNLRSDVIENYPENPPNSLDTIKVFNASGQCLKQIALTHSYFVSSQNTGIDANTIQTVIRNDVTDTKRLKLVSVTELSGDGALKKPPYVFTYQENVGLPRRMSFDQDHWGYCNNSGGANNYNFFPTLQHPACALPVQQGANRSARWPDMSGFMISTIKDPLGGSTAFDFEPDSGSYKNGPVQMGGGIRIHKITVTDGVTATAKITSYYYGDNGGSGVLYHFPKYLWDLNNEYYKYKDTSSPFRGYISNPATKYLFKSSQSVVPLQDIDGNNIGYSTVKEIFGANGEGGYKIYNFQAQDTLNQSSRLDISNFASYTATPPPDPNYKVEIPGLYPNGHMNDILPQNLVYYTGSDVENYFPSSPEQLSFRRGNMLAVYTYDSTNNLLNSTANTYSVTFHENYLIRGFKGNQNVLIFNGSNVPNSYDYAYTFYKLHAGISHLASSVNTEYRNGQSMVNTSRFGYESAAHTLQTSDTVTNSMGDSLINKTYYSFDYANNATTDNVFAKISNRNYLTPVAKEIWKNNQLIKDTIIQYKDFASNSTDTFINPSAMYALEVNNPLTQTQAGENIALTGKLPALLPNAYLMPQSSYLYSGVSGKVLQQQLVNNTIQSIIWDNQYSFPLAQVDNAAYGDIAYCSFETAEMGNWLLSDTVTNGNYGFTGSRSYDLTSSKTITASATGSQPYIVSYWSRGGGLTVKSNGTIIAVKSSGPTRNQWTYYEHLLPAGTTSVSVTSASATIDELRLYPSTAQMTTYTYKPLVGMTSQCDVNNRVIYYEYDNFIRLKDIKDQDGNILKTMDYHYQGQ